MLRRLLLTVVIGLGLLIPGVADAASPPTASDGAKVVAETQVAPRQVDLTIDSPALGTTAKVRLLTPDGWSAGAKKHWPTLWLLHGCCGDYTSWTAFTDVASIQSLRHVLVVMPEAGDAGWYSNWYGQTTPKWETFHLTEVRQIVERYFGAGPDRVVAGLSMGGFGALSYAGRHPGMFRAAASYSGVVDPLYEPGGPENIESIDVGQGFPADAPWGSPVQQRWNWVLHDPYYLAPLLRRIPVFISCGNGQPGVLDPPGTGFNDFEALFDAEAHGLVGQLHGDRNLHTDFYGNGTHAWPYWQRELHRSLPMLLKALNSPSRG